MKSRHSLYFALLVLLISAIVFRTNTGAIFAFIGNYHYKHNNISKAQKFYEKSFAVGNKDAQLREIYVNSIINSPLTIESQEKLAKIAEDKTSDSASVRAKYFLCDLRREIHRKYPSNYIKQAPYNQKIIHWNNFPITYKFTNPQSAPEGYVKAISDAFSEWERVGNVIFAETNEGKADITIEFDESKKEDIDYGKKYIIAYTTPIINISTLERMEIKFYTSTPDGREFTQNQIYNTALHEIFHALGFMGHSYDREDIMYLSKDAESVESDEKSELTEADINTLKLLYKIKPDITNKENLPAEYITYLVLGDEEDVTSAKAREAKHYITKAPALPSGYIDLAESYVAQKNYPPAIKCLEKALSLAETDDVKYIVYYNLAVSYFYINHLEMALDYAQKASEINDTEELHYLLAEIYLKKDVKKAIQEYEFLIGNSPQNIDYVINLANIHIKSKNYLSARKVLKTFVKLNPSEAGNLRLSPYKMIMF